MRARIRNPVTPGWRGRVRNRQGPHASESVRDKQRRHDGAVTDHVGSGIPARRLFRLHDAPFRPDYAKSRVLVMVSPRNPCIGFEDSGSGVKSLNRAGMFCIAVHPDHTSRSELASADLRFANLTETLRHLDHQSSSPADCAGPGRAPLIVPRRPTWLSLPSADYGFRDCRPSGSAESGAIHPIRSIESPKMLDFVECRPYLMVSTPSVTTVYDQNSSVDRF